jgi:hypothetical protein
MIEGRIVLEKTRALEGKLKYQVEKLVRLAREPEKAQVAANGEPNILIYLFFNRVIILNWCKILWRSGQIRKTSKPTTMETISRLLMTVVPITVNQLMAFIIPLASLPFHTRMFQKPNPARSALPFHQP